MGDIIETNDAGLMSTSAVLFYCKSRVCVKYNIEFHLIIFKVLI